MYQSDDIDIILNLRLHGWSMFLISLLDKTIEFDITHVFDDPYENLITALTELINGSNSVSIYWYSEPGGHKIEINRQMTAQHKLIVSIHFFHEGYGRQPREFDEVVQFEIKQRHLVSLFYTQLLKTSLLLQDKEYAKDRTGELPAHTFYKFQQIVKEYLKMEI